MNPILDRLTQSLSGRGGDIIAMRPGIDSIARVLVATAAEELSPELSPDGRWLAYTSNESGRREVYVRSFFFVDGAQRAAP